MSSRTGAYTCTHTQLGIHIHAHTAEYRICLSLIFLFYWAHWNIYILIGPGPGFLQYMYIQSSAVSACTLSMAFFFLLPLASQQLSQASPLWCSHPARRVLRRAATLRQAALAQLLGSRCPAGGQVCARPYSLGKMLCVAACCVL